MTQDEVDLIYNYLHENYEYREGELLCKRDGPGWKKGRRLGDLNYGRSNEKPFIGTVITIQGKKYYRRLHTLIYLFHYKCIPKYIKHLNTNTMDNRIENLEPAEKSEFLTKHYYKNEPQGYWVLKTKGGDKYVVSVEHKTNKVHIGCFNNKDDALNAFYMARKLVIEEELSLSDIKILVLNKYKTHVQNKHGYRGVVKSGNRYCSYISLNKIKTLVGWFDTPEEAHAAYLKAKEEYKNESNKNN